MQAILKFRIDVLIATRFLWKSRKRFLLQLLSHHPPSPPPSSFLPPPSSFLPHPSSPALLFSRCYIFQLTAFPYCVRIIGTFPSRNFSTAITLPPSPRLPFPSTKERFFISITFPSILDSACSMLLVSWWYSSVKFV